MPSLLEYLSYNCNFMSILAGPTCSYNDYVAFVEGTAYQPKHLESNGKENGKYKQTEPSPRVSTPRTPSTPSTPSPVELLTVRRFPVIDFNVETKLSSHGYREIELCERT